MGDSHERRPEDVQATFCEVIVNEWIRQGVRHAILAPGSRSTPMALALTRAKRLDSSLTVDVFHDERGAAFAALGTALVSGRPAVVLCTSGTAAAHLYAAVIEADLSCVPMIVCTADRPPELRDVGAPQTIDQTKMFGSSVRWFHDPGVPTEDSSSSWQSLAARSYWLSTGSQPGPVHVNFPFREPLVGRVLPTLVNAKAHTDPTHERVLGRRVLTESDIARVVDELNDRRGVIIAGRGCGAPLNVQALAASLDWPVFAEPRSGCGAGGHTVHHFDALVRIPQIVESLVPDVIVRLGEPPSSKALSQWVTSSGARQIHISGSGRIHDPDHRLHLRLEVDVDDALISIAVQVAKSAEMAKVATEMTLPEEGWFSRWIAVDHVARELLEELDRAGGRMTGLRVARNFIGSVPSGSQVVLSSSMPIRDVEWFAGDASHVSIHANRGANGIDGVIATAAGVARASRQPTFVLLGDVATIHDASTLMTLSNSDLDVRVLIINNDGGGIFHHLPQAVTVDEETFESIYGTPHGVAFAGLARSLGLRTFEIEFGGDLREVLTSRGPSLTEIRTHRDSDLDAHREFHGQLSSRIGRLGT